MKIKIKKELIRALLFLKAHEQICLFDDELRQTLKRPRWLFSAAL
jgi:hypothetical protein